MDQSPQECFRNKQSIVRLAVGDAQAIYWNKEVFCKECRTPLMPANKVVHTLGGLHTCQARGPHP
eukprot:5399773-Prorocentrum_lima.AAC.1